MSVTDPRLPRSVASVTASPPLVMLTLLESFSCTVTVEVDAPSAAIEVGDAVISDVVASAGTRNTTVSLSVMAAAFTEPVIVAVPGVTAEVKVAV